MNPEDTVWHLGDFCFARGYDKVASIVKQLNGAKFFIKGNHCDRKIMQRLRDENLIQWFGDYKEIYLKEEVDGKLVKHATCLFHFPVTAWHKQGHGSFHLHGHCVDTETEVLTPLGFKSKLDIEVGDLVGTVSEDGFTDYQQVTNQVHRGP